MLFMTIAARAGAQEYHSRRALTYSSANAVSVLGKVLKLVDVKGIAEDQNEKCAVRINGTA